MSSTRRLVTPFPWSPGEHLSLIGMTGSGKSTLASRLLELRHYVVVLRSKADRIEYPGMQRVTRAAAMDDPRVSRLELAPAHARQRDEFAAALDRVWEQGGWTCYVDELWYLSRLDLGDRIDRNLTQGRDPGRISQVCGMQRPTQVTRFAVGESSHVVAFGMEGRDVKILGEATGPRVARHVQEVPQHHFVWYHIPSRRIWRGTLDLERNDFAGEFVT